METDVSSVLEVAAQATTRPDAADAADVHYHAKRSSCEGTLQAVELAETPYMHT